MIFTNFGKQIKVAQFIVNCMVLTSIIKRYLVKKIAQYDDLLKIYGQKPLFQIFTIYENMV